jgi:branched-chain amino acid transport system ATP-binding protein
MTGQQVAISLENVSRRYGAVDAVAGVSMAISTGERRAILGPNGAGKTTLFNVICGDVFPTGGSIALFGSDITRVLPHHRIRAGLGRTYQNALLFNELSVLDNLYIAVRGVRPRRFSFRRPGRGDRDLAQAREVAERARLGHVLPDAVNDLSHGQRRQLELAMALASDPRILMLDEPAAGLSPGDRPELLRFLGALPRTLTLILIEHDIDIALPVADRVTVMKDGVVLVEDTPDRIGGNAAVQEIYLGSAH